MSQMTASHTSGTKRAYQEVATHVDTDVLEKQNSGSEPLNSASATSAFRNVSACNRCRVRKNKCDQRLPACTACEKANVRCVGYDPITKREIPRSYVYFLESRLSYFESLLIANDIRFEPPEAHDGDPRDNSEKILSPTSTVNQEGRMSFSIAPEGEQKTEDEAIDKLVSNIGLVSVQGASDHRYLGSTSGISFARVVLSAVKNSTSTNTSERTGVRPGKPLPNIASGGSSMRDSYFGLQTKPQMKEAPFPDRELAEKLVNLYFEHANPQIPILHRVEFMDMFHQAYQEDSMDGSQVTPRELFFLNIVFAIGAGIIWGSSNLDSDADQYTAKRARLSGQQAQPEEYHASAIVHLSSILSSAGVDSTDRPSGDLEELQAVLLLAGFALLRPVAPGLWYIVGVAVRLAIDLGLHYEDGSEIDPSQTKSTLQNFAPHSINARERGRREWTRDLRRRLWWCTYTFDRLVSTCVGRPFGITDQVITTNFPSLLEDKYITKGGFNHTYSVKEPTYKRVSYHYFRLRLLQSEILQVLQYQQAQKTRSQERNHVNEFMHTNLTSPFLIQHSSFRSWRQDVDQRLWEWKESAPRKEETGVAFSVQFLELNYWQLVTVLYRQSLAVPDAFANETSPTGDVTSPSSTVPEEKEDEDLVFLKCAEAGQKTLRLYRQLHRKRLVNYTYLATHHLFMAGISFLYAVWHSPAVRSKLTLDDFDFTVLAATSVLSDLMEKCPPAEACRDAFERMSKATVQMCMSSPNLGFGTPEESRQTSEPAGAASAPTINTTPSNLEKKTTQPRGIRTKRPPPKFDMNLKDLFPDSLNMTEKPSTSLLGLQNQHQRNPQDTRYRHSQSHRQLVPRSNSMSANAQVNEGMGINQHVAPSSSLQSNPLQQQISPVMPSTSLRPQYINPDQDQNTYNPDFMSNNLPGLEFLSNLPGMSGGNHLVQNNNLRATPQTQLATSPILSNPVTNDGSDWSNMGMNIDQDSEWNYGSGFGVGVGMGLDFNQQHDFSDGQGGFDIFDEFFFGGNDVTGQ